MYDYYYTSNGVSQSSKYLDIEKITSDTYQAAVNVIANHMSKLEFKHQKKSDQSSYLEKMLNGKPNPYMTAQSFVYKLVSNTLMQDNGWVYPEFNFLTGKYKAFWVLDPSQVSLKKNKSNNLFVEFTFGNGQSYTLPYQSLIHIRSYFQKDDILGGTDPTNFNETLKNYNESKESISNAAKASSRVIATYKVNEMLNDDDVRRAIDRFNEYINTASNQNSIFPQDMRGELVPLNLSPKSAAHTQIESLKKDVLERLNISESIVKGDYSEQQFNSFYESVLEPLSIQISQAFTWAIFTTGQIDNGNSIKAIDTRLIHASWTTKLGVIDRLFDKQGMTINEARELLGFSRREDGDKYLQTLNVVDGDKANQYQLGEGDNGGTNGEE